MSGVNDYCYIHYYIQQQNTSNRLIRDILSSPAPESDSSQLAQGGSKVRRLVNQLLWEGLVQNIILKGTSEQPDLRKLIYLSKKIKKKVTLLLKKKKFTHYVIKGTKQLSTLEYVLTFYEPIK